MKIIVTGGHLTPALASIDELRSRKPDWKILFIGRDFAMEGIQGSSYEQKEIESRGLPFLALTTGRFTRHISYRTIISLCKIPVGLHQAFRYCRREKPDIVMSFGGYIALPVVLAAAFLHIPVITHEQTMSPGLANRLISGIARKVCVTFESSARHFPSGKAIFTGLPVRKEFLAASVPEPDIAGFRKRPVLYITGGSTGSVSMNALLFPIIPDLVRTYTVIHQTGTISHGDAVRLHDSLPEKYRDRYIVKPYFDGRLVAPIVSHAALIISRAGANTVTELAMLGAVSILIPLPWSASGEQKKNAEWLVSNGTSEMVLQDKSNSEQMYSKITHMMSHMETYRKQARILSGRIPRNGAARLIDEIITSI